MRTFWQDARYAFRMLARYPGFAAVVVVILAVGIGANTAVFSVVNAVLLRPLPYRDADRIVRLWECVRKEGLAQTGTSHHNFRFWREQNQVFESIAAMQNRRVYLTGIDQPRHVRAIAASSCVFSLLGVQPFLGRGFLPEEELPGNDRVVVLSHAFWRDCCGASADVIGKPLELDGERYTVVGVMPAAFHFPFRRPAPFWVPLVLERGGTGKSMSRGTSVLARLKKEVTLKRARAEMAALALRLEQIEPSINRGFSVTVSRLLDDAVKDSGRLLLLLLGAAGFVLLITCGNAANLFLARATTRQREIGLRVALGARRSRIVRQMLTESLVVSVAAGLLGLAITFWTIRGLVGLCPVEIPRMAETRVDVSVLLFTLGVSVLTGLVFGAMPAWRAGDTHLARTLKEGSPQSPAASGWRHFRGCLVVAQISVTLVLLTGAGLLIRTMMALQELDLGFRPGNVATLHLELPRVKYPESHHCKAFYEQLLQRVRVLPEVRSATLVSGGLELGTGGGYLRVSVDDRPADDPDERRWAKQMDVSPGFFETMGIRLLRGRTFTDQDVQSGTPCTIIDEHMARTYFPEADPIGRSINSCTIIGVVSTIRDFETLSPAHDTFYSPLSNYYFRTMDLVVRTERNPMRLAGALRAQVRALDRDQAISEFETLDTRLAGTLATRRFSMVLLGSFAGAALLLAAVGVYGLLQYNVTQQIHDIGIHMALGARGGHMLKKVLRQGLRLALIGLAIGLAGALALARVLAGLLYEVRPTDPLTLACVCLVLAVVALLASYLPARRAARIDPMVALRYE